MSEPIELFSARVCPYAHRTRLVLHEKSVDFTLAISAYGKVPALVQGDVEIYESAIINEYLEEKYPQPRLLPADPHRRALARI